MDLNTVRNKRIMEQNNLNYYLSNPTNFQKEIIASRGRLIKLLYQEHALETNVQNKIAIQNEIYNQSRVHKLLLNNRISNTKVSNNNFANQITSEVALKFRKATVDFRAMKNADNFTDGLKSGVKGVGSVISAVGSATKVPIVTTLKLLEKLSPVVCKLLVQPLQIPGYLFSMIINPEHKYNGEMINNMGKVIGEGISEILKVTETGIKRI